MAITAAELKAMREALPSDVPGETQLRVYRAVRWLERAEKEKDDADVEFILYWIALNALYADDLGELNTKFRSHTRQFFDKIVKLDRENKIHDLIWNNFSQSIRTLLDNEYASSYFWRALRDGKPESWWRKKLEKENEWALKSFRHESTSTLLEVIFNRLYVVRNQLVHGGSTHNSSVNRDQIKDGVRILATFVPIIAKIMIENPHEDYGRVTYPVVGKKMKEFGVDYGPTQ